MTSHSRLVFSRRAVTCFFLLPFSFLIQNAPAQIQQAWVARYNNGILNGTNQAVKMALDSTGNICVLGFSQNTNANLGYVTIKYAPNGTLLWAARFDSTIYPSATPSGFALDSSNNVVVTGNALTVKYDPNGNQLWTAPYKGAAVAIDSGGDSFVTGFGSTFDTVKIAPNGTNLWSTSYIEPNGPVISQAVAVDSGGNSYVAGSDTYDCFSEGPIVTCVNGLLVIKYDRNGNQIWKNIAPMGSVPEVQVAGLALDSASNVDVIANAYEQPYSSYSYSQGGSLNWTASNPDSSCGSDIAHGFVLDNSGELLATGQSCYFAPSDAYATFVYGTYKANTNGAWVWTNTYPGLPVQPSVANTIAIDSANNSYVTGYSPGANGTNDIVTIKYDPNGNQVWVQRYSSPSGGNAAGNAIAVDKNGNVSVTGYDTTAQGGTEIVTIKYSPITLQRRSDGTVLLQAQGSPGESFDIEASTNLLDWLDLGAIQADTNGLLQFDDTNAPAFPARFYHTTPQ